MRGQMTRFAWGAALAALILLVGGCAVGTEGPGGSPAGEASRVVPAAGASRDAAVAALRNVAAAQVAYSADIKNGGAYGSFRDLCAQGKLDRRFDSDSPQVNGFTYSMSAGQGSFKCVARGKNANEDVVFAVNETGTIFSDESCTTPAKAD